MHNSEREAQGSLGSPGICLHRLATGSGGLPFAPLAAATALLLLAAPLAPLLVLRVVRLRLGRRRNRGDLQRRGSHRSVSASSAGCARLPRPCRATQKRCACLGPASLLCCFVLARSCFAPAPSPMPPRTADKPQADGGKTTGQGKQEHTKAQGQSRKACELPPAAAGGCLRACTAWHQVL